MKVVAGQTESAGFTRRDLLVSVIACALLLLLAFPAMIRAKRRAQRIACCGQLAQISLAFKQWSLDHANAYPMNLSTNFGGTQEWALLGEACRYFAAISNELNTPLLLACPSDTRRKSARNFASLANSKISYWLAVPTEGAQPQTLLAGDRNLLGGTRLTNGIVELTTNDLVSWGRDLHNGVGNVALADGSVVQPSASLLREAIKNTGCVTNRILMP